MLKNEFKFEESYFIAFYLELKKLATSCSMWDGSSPRGNGTHALNEAWGPNHWMAGEFSHLQFLSKGIGFFKFSIPKLCWIKVVKMTSFLFWTWGKCFQLFTIENEVDAFLVPELGGNAFISLPLRRDVCYGLWYMVFIMLSPLSTFSGESLS